ncbi:rod shape-determining protein MreD [Balneolales bacterium ANBcel1]|nr:rod shape-determining protein MreD [Balneolales bacterium ANBcel1]
MKSDVLKFGLIGLAAIVLQVLVFNHLSYRAIRPDITLVVLIWVIATQNRTLSLIFAGYIGLMNDLFHDLWGLHLLSKTLTTLLVYRFVPRIEETKLFFTQVFLLLFVITFVHNLFFLLSALFTQTYATEHIIIELLIGSSLLTTAVGSIIHLLREN